MQYVGEHKTSKMYELNFISMRDIGSIPEWNFRFSFDQLWNPSVG